MAKNMKTYMRRRRAANRAYALEKLGSKCFSCGSMDSLEFDHVDRNKKNMGVADMFSHSKKKLDKELSLCQLLCKPCHDEKTFSDLGYRHHGTIRAYRRGCRCNECSQKWESYKIKHNARRRELRKYSKVS